MSVDFNRFILITTKEGVHRQPKTHSFLNDIFCFYSVIKKFVIEYISDELCNKSV